MLKNKIRKGGRNAVEEWMMRQYQRSPVKAIFVKQKAE